MLESLRISTKRFTSSNNKGFTLIELLVVIAIIAVLMGILMPSLRKSKEQTRKISCRSNMKQIAIAIGANHASYYFDFTANQRLYYQNGTADRAHKWIWKKRVTGGTPNVNSSSAGAMLCDMSPSVWKHIDAGDVFNYTFISSLHIEWSVEHYNVLMKDLSVENPSDHDTEGNQWLWGTDEWPVG